MGKRLKISKNINDMKPRIKHFSLALLGIVVAAGCNDFGDMNINPNAVSTPQTAFLMTNAQKSISSVIGAITPSLYVQYFAETQYDEDARYQTVQFNFNSWYTGPLKDLDEIILKVEANPDLHIGGGAPENQIAVARILKVYFMQMMVDRWGPLPYSEALQGNENYKPNYDSADAIYADLLSELQSAASQVNTSALGPTGDIIFDGDMSQWIKFAHTMRARIALRMADSSPSTAKSEFESAASNLLNSDVFYPYLAESANQNPFYTQWINRPAGDYAITDKMDDFMSPKGDLRITKYAEPAPLQDNGDGITQINEIVGHPYSMENPGSITNAEVSLPGGAIGAGGPGIGQQDAPLPIITMAEIHFMLAEAAARGWNVTGDAPTHYGLAIKASWEQWGVYEESAYTAYMAHGDVIYDPTNYKKSIGEQKWVALYPLGYEAWAEWRRLGYPQLEPHEYPLNPSGQIPLRHAYPASELTLNEDSYNAALGILGGPDDETTPIFWDVD